MFVWSVYVAIDKLKTNKKKLEKNVQGRMAYIKYKTAQHTHFRMCGECCGYIEVVRQRCRRTAQNGNSE